MKKEILYIFFGAFLLIITDSILRYFQMISFNDYGDNADFDLARIFFLFSLILFQWVFILAMFIFYFIRKRIRSQNMMLNWLLGFIICFAFYSFYWLGADQGSLKTLRMAIINCTAFGFIMEKLYQKMVQG